MGLILVVGIGLLVFASGQKGSEGLPSDTQSALSDYGAALEKPAMMQFFFPPPAHV